MFVLFIYFWLMYICAYTGVWKVFHRFRIRSKESGTYVFVQKSFRSVRMCIVAVYRSMFLFFFSYIYVKKNHVNQSIHILCDAYCPGHVWKVTLFTIFSNTYFTRAQRLSEFVFSYNIINLLYFVCVHLYISIFSFIPAL